MLKFFLLLATLVTLSACSAGHKPIDPEHPDNQLKDPAYLAWEIACNAAASIAPGACTWGPGERPTHRGIASVRLPVECDDDGCWKQFGIPSVTFGRAEFDGIIGRWDIWPAVYIFGHEIGHAKDWDTGAIFLMSRHGMELSADEWGGCIVARAGATWEDLTSVLSMIRLVLDESDSHPSPDKREASFVAGFRRCLPK